MLQLLQVCRYTLVFASGPVRRSTVEVTTKPVEIDLINVLILGKLIPNLSLQNIGVSRTKGRRAYNEDQYGIEQLIIGSITPDATNPPQSFLYLAVFDGHGGPACSKFCAQTFPRHVSICQFCSQSGNPRFVMERLK